MSDQPDTEQTQPSSPVTAEAPPPLAAEVAAVPAAGDAVQPEAVVEAAPEAPAASAESTPGSAPAPARTRRPRVVKPLVSDDTLADWQAKLAADRAAKERERRREQAAVAARQERAEAFRTLRQALAALQQAPAEPADAGEADLIVDDALARQVHEAPAHVRAVVASTLALLAGGRGKRR